MNRFICIFFILLIFNSCKKEESSTYNKGEMILTVDESFKNVSEALSERYMVFYPDTKIKIKFEKEEYAFMDLINQKTTTVVMSRELTQKEKQLFTSKFEMPLQPAKFAGDAVVFIVPKSSNRNTISLEEIRSELLSDKKRIIFDGANTGNFSFVAQKLNLKPQEIKFSVLKGNEQIIDQINKYPNNIGVISFNTISNPYSKTAAALRDKIKILSVIDDKGKSFEPNRENIRFMQYPFTRILYFLTNEGYFGIANGFIRFSCTQIGQIVVSKEGLQPYNIFKREVQMR